MFINDKVSSIPSQHPLIVEKSRWEGAKNLPTSGEESSREGNHGVPDVSCALCANCACASSRHCAIAPMGHGDFAELENTSCCEKDTLRSRYSRSPWSTVSLNLKSPPPHAFPSFRSPMQQLPRSTSSAIDDSMQSTTQPIQSGMTTVPTY